MYVIYRSWDQGILGKSVRHLPEPTVLGWVRDRWGEAQDPYEWLERELGTAVFGLDELFSAEGAAPRDMRELRTLAMTRLPETYRCNVDEHSVRVLANGLDYDVAYYLVDDAAVAARPERWSFAVHDGSLPARSSPGARVFTPPLPVTELTDQPRSGEGTVYAVLLTCKAKYESIGWNPTYALSGMRLPRFGAALREIDTATGEWPIELEVLRALVAPGEDGIAAALERCNRWPAYKWVSGEQPHPPRSHAEALRLLDGDLTGRQRSVIEPGDHVAQLFMGGWREDFEQWFLFDDRWADANPELAESLMWFAYHWDPLCARDHLFLTPCSDNRVRYVAVVGDDGRTLVRQAEPRDEPQVWDLRHGSYGEVLGTVEIQVHQPLSDTCEFTEFRIGAPDVAELLARRIKGDLLEAGISRVTGWFPEEYLYERSGEFLRTLGRVDESDVLLHP